MSFGRRALEERPTVGVDEDQRAVALPERAGRASFGSLPAARSRRGHAPSRSRWRRRGRSRWRRSAVLRGWGRRCRRPAAVVGVEFVRRPRRGGRAPARPSRSLRLAPARRAAAAPRVRSRCGAPAPRSREPGPTTRPPSARLGDLRHLHATILLSSGAPVHIVAVRLGHADPTTTLSIYSHVSRPMSRKQAVNASDVFRRRSRSRRLMPTADPANGSGALDNGLCAAEDPSDRTPPHTSSTRPHAHALRHEPLSVPNASYSACPYSLHNG